MITRCCTTVWNAVNAIQVCEKRIFTPGHTTCLKTNKCVTLLRRFRKREQWTWTYWKNWSVSQRRCIRQSVIKPWRAVIAFKLQPKSKEVQRQCQSTHRTSCTIFNKQRWQETLQLGYCAKTFLLYYVWTSSVSMETWDGTAKRPTPTDQENGTRQTVCKHHWTKQNKCNVNDSNLRGWAITALAKWKQATCRRAVSLDHKI